MIGDESIAENFCINGYAVQNVNSINYIKDLAFLIQSRFEFDKNVNIFSSGSCKSKSCIVSKCVYSQVGTRVRHFRLCEKC
jgi:hypothetical protein